MRELFTGTHPRVTRRCPADRTSPARPSLETRVHTQGIEVQPVPPAGGIRIGPGVRSPVRPAIGHEGYGPAGSAGPARSRTHDHLAIAPPRLNQRRPLVPRNDGSARRAASGCAPSSSAPAHRTTSPAMHTRPPDRRCSDPLGAGPVLRPLPTRGRDLKGALSRARAVAWTDRRELRSRNAPPSGRRQVESRTAVGVRQREDFWRPPEFPPPTQGAKIGDAKGAPDARG